MHVYEHQVIRIETDSEADDGWVPAAGTLEQDRRAERPPNADGIVGLFPTADLSRMVEIKNIVSIIIAEGLSQRIPSGYFETKLLFTTSKHLIPL